MFILNNAANLDGVRTHYQHTMENGLVFFLFLHYEPGNKELYLDLTTISSHLLHLCPVNKTQSSGRKVDETVKTGSRNCYPRS